MRWPGLVGGGGCLPSRPSPMPVLFGVAAFILGGPSAPLPSAGSPQGSRPRQQSGALFPCRTFSGGFAISLSVVAGLEAPLIPSLPAAGPKHLVSCGKVNLSVLFPIASRKPAFPGYQENPPVYSFWAQCGPRLSTPETQPRTGWKHPWRASWRRWHWTWASEDVGGN